ncbi:hypothetical protein M8542_19695 [Amycolatopsis sp. OK19-0408]|uniref:Uncharacterized protein n=1 Tax=Amycolatopsis iheyensis TaxID=2945988 RepID=A0A9X2NHU0_9PSEU|nr:hypothetical protein [Amycolatopsis iheyensis]MCR6485055.1 hypothetical protein [Amycolatopsis iheyensis]
MTAVRVPVRIRLDLTGDPADSHVLDVVRRAAVEAASRVADRAGRAYALDGATFSDQAPDVSVRFAGDAVPAWAAAHLEATAHAAVRTVTAALRPAPAPASAPGPTTFRFRRFATTFEVLDALDAYYGGAARPPRVLVVVANSGGAPLMLAVVLGPDGTAGVEWGILLNRFVLPADGRDAESVPGYAVGPADSFHLVAEPATDDAFRVELAAALVRIWRATGSAEPESRLAERAAARAKRFRLKGALYEFRSGGVPVAWFAGRAGLADRDGLPLLVLTEEVAAQPGADRYGKDCPPLRYDPDAADDADPDRPFLHELEVSDWDGEDFGDLIDSIAAELGVPKPRFIGSFVFAALDVITRRSESLGRLPATEARQEVLGHLVRALEAVNVLLFAYTKAVLARDKAKKLPCPLAGQAGDWAGYLHRDYFPRRRKVVASLFVAACQDALLEVLEKSAADIAHRRATTDWLRGTRVVLTVLLADLPELTDMLGKLRRAKQLNDSTVRFTPEPGRNHQSVDGVEVVRTPVFPGRDVPGRDPFRTGYRIKDAQGRWHTLAEVEATVKTLRSTAQLTDPFLEKLADVGSVVRRLRVAQQLDAVGAETAGRVVTDAVDREFFAVLEEIAKTNEEKTQEARDDRMVAYGLATFEPDAANDVHAKLTGVHQLADKRLRAMFTRNNAGASIFGDEHIYVEGLAALAGHEIAKARFREFFELAGITLLAVFFPEAAFVIGLFQAAEGIHTAHEHADLQRSLLGGDDILSRAQVEAELAGAWVQGFLAIAPELPAVVRDGIAGVRALAKGELTEATSAALRRKLLEVSGHLATITAEHFAASFLTQLAAGYVLNLALSEVISEVAAAVAADYRTDGTIPGVEITAYAMRTLAAAVTASSGAGS